MINQTDVIIVGAGAAGLMCAMTAARRGRRVVVLEQNEQVGKKILISGGGRCNFTNLLSGPDNFISENPHFFKSALSRYSPTDFVELVKKHNIAFHEKKNGQLFCDHSAKDIVSMLLSECADGGVRMVMKNRVEEVRYDECYTLQTNTGIYKAPHVVIATGGLSIPKIGATDFGLRLAEKFGHRIVPPEPALVPLQMDAGFIQRYGDLTGISIEVIISCEKKYFHENMLFTHQGISGPAVLQISSYWKKGDILTIDLLPNKTIEQLLDQYMDSRSDLVNVLSYHFPKRFIQSWCVEHFSNKPVYQLSSKELNNLDEKIHRWKLIPVATAGFEKAEVTRGGVDTRDISSKTMESVKQNGLYFVGEVVDVTGHLGGHNFQWAWASGHAAGLFV
ncbi:MAG TPA: NAD(P)/FAD-dependent oxidoreductase [bacterium]|nr:NAD(P)/FAD-dependent oxidoreductase [bacterium]HMY37264.1 NAD(P)/FAD-dependent oxidoreductase [bacterium]HMZ03496.1 NAD(P)/FAD-dependent oxidoreductase [bacterium]HND76602.1 NAD(P)/FAD-dependent oxidoreductase [bacterium]HNH33318.1 NAD(P)/FAD-dependent oxidoreductase [bacterium]